MSDKECQSKQHTHTHTHISRWTALQSGHIGNIISSVSATLSLSMSMRNTPSSVQSNDLKLLHSQVYSAVANQRKQNPLTVDAYTIIDPNSMIPTLGRYSGTPFWIAQKIIAHTELVLCLTLSHSYVMMIQSRQTLTWCGAAAQKAPGNMNPTHTVLQESDSTRIISSTFLSRKLEKHWYGSSADTFTVQDIPNYC